MPDRRTFAARSAMADGLIEGLTHFGVFENTPRLDRQTAQPT